ncbi:MAG: hypothetical protein KDB23_13595, partial [Planctomycetales bacterium]|nr:hypothetical protein [Planctomycetales bacterium]
VFNPQRLFLLRTNGIGDTALGQVLPRGLSIETLMADFSIQGSMLPSGGLGQVTIGYAFIPEPASCTLALVGLMLLAVGYRR